MTSVSSSGFTPSSRGLGPLLPPTPVPPGGAWPHHRSVPGPAQPTLPGCLCPRGAAGWPEQTPAGSCRGRGLPPPFLCPQQHQLLYRYVSGGTRRTRTARKPQLGRKPTANLLLDPTLVPLCFQFPGFGLPSFRKLEALSLGSTRGTKHIDTK